MNFFNFRGASVQLSIAAIMGLVGSANSMAADEASKAAEFAVRYRQGIYTVMFGNFAPLGGVVKGSTPYDAKQFTQRAERVAYLSLMAGEAFPAGSQSGAPMRAKPEIWTNRAEFDSLMKDWQEKAATLAKTSRSGKLEKIKPAFVAVGGACKACHDKFRDEEKH